MTSGDAFTSASPRRRATLDGWGVPGPIEERAGRRLLRLVDPASEEGRQLLSDGAVELIGPEGDSLGAIGLEEACQRLRRRLAAGLGKAGAAPATRRRSSAPS